MEQQQSVFVTGTRPPASHLKQEEAETKYQDLGKNVRFKFKSDL